MFKSLTSVQLEPFQDSVCAFGPAPPNAKADVLSTPAPDKLFLAVPKSLTSVQLVPFQDSVTAVTGSPPKAKLDVEVPRPPRPFLAVFKSFTSVHDEPLYDSVSQSRSVLVECYHQKRVQMY